MKARLPLALLLAAAACSEKKPQERIAFVSWRSGTPAAHLVRADGTDLLAASTSRAWFAAPPIWSADGTRVAWTVETGPDAWAIEVYDVATKSASIAAKGYKVEAWTPDGSRFIATNVVDNDEILAGQKPVKRQRQQLSAVTADGTAKRTKISDGAGWDFAPAISPDGKSLAYVSNRDEQVELRVAPLDGGAHRRLVRGPDALASPVWSPDGSRIVFECKRSGAPHVCRVDASGAGFVPLAAGSTPSFSPDGSRIVFTVENAEGKGQIHVMSADGSDVRALTTEGHNTRARFSADGTRLAFVSDASGNAEVVVMPAAGGTPLVVSNAPARDGFPSWQPKATP